jgi:hypothetical protein
LDLPARRGHKAKLAQLDLKEEQVQQERKEFKEYLAQAVLG